MFNYATIKLTSLMYLATTAPWAWNPNACGDSGHKFFFFPSWWEYLPSYTDPLGVCSPTLNGSDGSFHFVYIIFIGLAIIDMLLRVAGFIAVLSIIASGFQHVFSGGNPEKAATARRRIYNSFIGLAIVLAATAIVTFLGNQLGPHS